LETKRQSDWNNFLRKSRGEPSKNLKDLEEVVRPHRKIADLIRSLDDAFEGISSAIQGFFSK
jgi:predicted trehalose synthase